MTDNLEQTSIKAHSCRCLPHDDLLAHPNSAKLHETRNHSQEFHPATCRICWDMFDLSFEEQERWVYLRSSKSCDRNGKWSAQSSESFFFTGVLFLERGGGAEGVKRSHIFASCFFFRLHQKTFNDWLIDSFIRHFKRVNIGFFPGFANEPGTWNIHWFLNNWFVRKFERVNIGFVCRFHQ